MFAKKFLESGKRKMLLPLQIQLFADDEKENEGEKEGEKKESQEEDKTDWKALYEKAKKEKDLASKEASDYKKKYREKQSAEELKAEEEKQRQIDIDNLKKENQMYKLTKNLNNGVFSNEDIDKLVNARYSDNDEDFATALKDVVKVLLDNQKKQLLEEFKRNPRLPNGSTSDSNNSNVELAKELAKNGNKPNREKYSKYFE